jgi:hypothetical protein
MQLDFIAISWKFARKQNLLKVTKGAGKGKQYSDTIP